MGIIFTTDQKMAHEFWKKGLRTGSVSLKLPTKADATRFRFMLYNAVRPIRQGKAFDEELLRATMECSVTTEDCTVTVGLKANSAAMLALMEQHGITGEGLSDPQTPEQAEITASIARVMEKVTSGEGNAPTIAARRVTPFYTRGGEGE